MPFFIRKKKTTIIGTREQGRRLIRVLREAVFGPTYVDANQDVHPTLSDSVVPNLKEEMKFYRNFAFNDLLAFRFFRDSRVSIGGVTITMDTAADYDVWQNDAKLTHIPGAIEYVARYAAAKTGVAFDDLVTQTVFQPLDLTEMAISPTKAALDNIALPVDAAGTRPGRGGDASHA